LGVVVIQFPPDTESKGVLEKKERSKGGGQAPWGRGDGHPSNLKKKRPSKKTNQLTTTGKKNT